MNNKNLKHYEDSKLIAVDQKTLFEYIDDHKSFLSHMRKPSGMMGGGSMRVDIDEGKGQKVGSHIRMHGKILGINLFLDEVVVQHDPPFRKAWETVGDINLLVIDHYRLGFEIESNNSTSTLRVYIDYNLPQSARTRILGYLLGGVYAKWCVNQMITGVRDHFE